jgi:hypothetical protein
VRLAIYHFYNLQENETAGMLAAMNFTQGCADGAAAKTKTSQTYPILKLLLLPINYST